MEQRFSRRIQLHGLAVGVLLASPSAALAQAWLPPRGEATLTFGVHYMYARDHLFHDGSRVDRGKMYTNNLVSDLNYGVTDRLALRVGIPYVISRYSGSFPHRPPGRPVNDDGTWNGTFQDFRIAARFAAARGSLVVTPYAAVGLPSHFYEHLSHSAAGRRLKEYSAGVLLGRRLDPLLPDAYAHARYSFTVPERVLGIWHNYSNADLELGYFVTPALAVRALGSWQVGHGGFRIPLDAPLGSANFLHHDQLANERHFNLGAGASFAVSGSLDVYVLGYQTLSGKNGVAIKSLGVGASWNFSPAQIIKKKRAAPRAAPGMP